ncbi:uroporphyrinogen-III C-methyltransferase [Azospirillum sp. SYSU D00513]|uniref:uroporphyrinogen-III C-methyltransferase n=1 Tax=Azospirillum sp. SYSU D00513 TaxID=2812561 RepID=UPI001FFFF1ED|nr:uroporphyrinogen-III C-methyltransferase [Azospirillum sp. SYSU D00513]
MPSAAMWRNPAPASLGDRLGGALDRLREILFRAPAGAAGVRSIEATIRPVGREAAATGDRPGRARNRVTLVGAGPGDPELLTVAAVRAIQAAEVVLYDHLVGPGILDLIPAGAERVCVGKRSGCHSHSQESINSLLERHAATGRRIVRLKGGDPMVFGRAGEEIDHLRARGHEVTVVPGVTAALGCAASAGISLTRRGVSRSLTFVTAHGREGDLGEPDWARLASPTGTLAVYMGREQARRVATGLTGAGLSPGTPVLAIENGCRPDERRHWTTLRGLIEDGPLPGSGPTMLLIGAALAQGMPEEVAAILEATA